MVFAGGLNIDKTFYGRIKLTDADEPTIKQKHLPFEGDADKF